MIGSNLVSGDGYWAIETKWRCQKEQHFEVVFVQHEGEWRIDWESYVRYSSTPWELFGSGAIQTTGDFRLYMREKTLSEVDEGVLIGVKFYPPNYDVKFRHKGESPTVRVRADSDLGKKVRAVLDGLEKNVELGEPRARLAD